ncbi:hypothetical protein ATERTT37_006721 [Aspergillus terreus]
MTSELSTFWTKADKYLMSTGVPYSPVVITKAKGTRLYAADNRQILDFTSGQMSSLLGHSHPDIVAVVQTHIAELDHLLSNMITAPVVDLAERLSRILPRPLEKSFFLNTGSESVEAAIKMAKLYTGKFEIVAFSASFHGLTQGAGAATYTAGRKNAGPTVPGQLAFPAPYAYRSPFRTPDGAYDWETEVDFAWSMIDRQSVGSLAAFVLEPILSTGGILDLPAGYLPRLSAECKKRGMLLIVDEAQTGIARTGDMFAFQKEGVVPDILALSKTLGCGLPLASVSTTAEIERGCREAGFLLITTHLNDPLPAAVGSKVLEVVERDNLCQHAAQRGAQLRAGLLKLQQKYWCIGDVRGRGLLQGIEIISDAQTKAPGPDLGQAVCNRAMELGLSCNVVNLPGMGGVFRLAPPVTVTAEEIEEGLQILDQAFADVLAKTHNISTHFRLLDVGAGLGGLGAAISLRLSGHEVIILEAAREIGEVGAGIQCLPNNTRILHKWDVRGTLRAKASTTQTCNIIGWKGNTISSMDFQAAGAEHGSPFNDFHRADLHRALLDRAVELGATVHTKCEVVDIRFDEAASTATVSIEDQPDLVADLVIGADGINSRCREILLGSKEPPHRTGDMAYRILLDAAEIRKDPELRTIVDDKAVNYWYGPGAHVVTYPLRGASVLNMVLLVPDNMPEEGPSTLQGYVDEMQGLFKDWDPRIGKLLAMCPSVLRWRLCIRKSIDSWVHPSGCFALLGDAAHATLPYLASGAGITFEDAAVLGECMDRIQSKSPGEKKRALEVYELCRKRRTETVVERGTIQQDLNHLDDGVKQEERDRKMRAFEAVERNWQAGKRGPLPSGLKPG